MKQLTIRKVDEAFHTAIKQKAKRLGQSINRYVLSILRRFSWLGEEGILVQEYNELDYLIGMWSQSDYDEFLDSYEDMPSFDEDV